MEKLKQISWLVVVAFVCLGASLVLALAEGEGFIALGFVAVTLGVLSLRE